MGEVANVIAVDIGGTHFRAGIFDPSGRRLGVLEGDTLRTGGRDWMLRQIAERCHALLQKSERHVKTCGVSFGGPVDFASQQVRSMHSPGWENFPLAQW